MDNTNSEYREFFSPIIEKHMIRLFSNYFDNIDQYCVYIDDILLESVNQHSNKIIFKIRVTPTTSRVNEDSGGYDIYDGDFVNMYARSYNDIVTELRTTFKKIFSYEYLADRGYNLDDYTLKFLNFDLDANTRIYLEKWIAYEDEDLRDLRLTNEIYIDLICKETDVSIYKPGGSGYMQSYRSFENKR
ncbi:MAG: hypothetical protein GY751_00250 [Bacteroidetes bacterium]|nr:hypothetical protein [Bacteroidota bacterium]